MNKKIILVLITSLLVYGCAGDSETEPITQPLQTITSGTTGMGDVRIDLTPKWTEQGLEVDFSANTHSVDLSQYDLEEITTLIIGGKELSPVSALEMRGHHNNGKLMFEAERSESFKIIINNIPNVEKREFTW